MSKLDRPPSTARGLMRIALYYMLLTALLVLLVQYVPAVREAVSGGRLQELGSDLGIFGPGSEAAPGVPIAATPWSGALLGAVSMLGALAIMVPVTWVYMFTRRYRGYHESVVHTLLILPVAVTGIVMIVQHSIALAFSLAGIVAAVRFRTTLEDTKDAVYVFLAIGVGLASGVQALGLALALSLVFNGVILVLWKTRFGNIYADRHARTGPIELGDVLAGPDSKLTRLHVGDPAVLDAAAPEGLEDVADRAVRIERYISEERSKKKRKRINALLIIHAHTMSGAQQYVEKILEELAAKWKLAEAIPGPNDSLILEYLARLEQPGLEGNIMDRLREAPPGVITAAEYRSLKGLKRRK